LKTLEEPPEHVKFFFATTEPNKIPITVLSRCQRYDFAGITPEQVVETLTEICKREGVKAEPDALRTVARRAAGSMRDAQSLLEQLLSAGGESLTIELVHKRLGTASDERLLDLLDALADHDSAAALRQVEQAANEGVQPADLLNGLLEFLRDLMVMSAGAESLMLAATPRQKPRLEKVVARWPLDTILAALQILAEARGRLRGSPHGRLIVELALARVARLENMRDLGEIIARLAALETGSSPSPGSGGDLKKKSPPPETPVTVAPPASPPARATPKEAPPAAAPQKPPAAPLAPLALETIREVWPGFVKKLGLRLGVPLMPYADKLSSYLAISGPDVLAIRVPTGYNHVSEACGTPEALAKIEHALQSLLRRPIKVRFDPCDGESASDAPVVGAPSPRPKDELLESDPMVRKVVELFEARRLHTEYDDDASLPPNGR
jgi:DNA polymerase III subunit gamma/tau